MGGSDGAVSATVATAPGTATAGSDYVPVSQSVSFADGQTSRTVQVPITDDPLVEGIDETVDLSLSAPTGGATLGSPTSAVLRIQDNDARANASAIAVPASARARSPARRPTPIPPAWWWPAPVAWSPT